MQGQKAAGLLVQNAEGRMLVVPKLRRKGACRGKKQEDWGLRSANAEGRGVAFCPTGLQNDAIFCPKYNVPTFLPKIWLFLAKIQLFSRGLEIVSANATSSPESETFSPREYHHLSPRNRTFSPLKCHFSLQIRTFSPKCNFSLPAVTKPPQNTPFLQKCSAFSPKYHFLPQR